MSSRAVPLRYEARSPDHAPNSETRYSRKRKKDEMEAIQAREQEKRNIKAKKAKEKQDAARANANHLRKKSDFIYKAKFSNNLPDVPVAPKYLKLPLSLTSLVPYTPTSLDLGHKHVIHAPFNLGTTLNAVDASIFRRRDNVKISDEDAALIADEIEPRQELQHTWLRNSEYISINPSSKKKDISRHGHVHLVNGGPEPSGRDEEVQFIERTFAVLDRPPRHPTKDGVTVKRMLPILPDLEGWENQYILAQFLEDPLTGEPLKGRRTPAEVSRLRHAVIKGYTEPEQFVAYLLPASEEACEQMERGEDNVPFEWIRELSHNARKEDDVSLFINFDERDGVARYNMFSSRMTLRKYKMKEGVMAKPRSITVVSRDFDEKEMEQREQKRALISDVDLGDRRGDRDNDPDREADDGAGVRRRSRSEDGGAGDDEDMGGSGYHGDDSERRRKRSEDDDHDDDDE